LIFKSLIHNNHIHADEATFPVGGIPLKSEGCGTKTNQPIGNLGLLDLAGDITLGVQEFIPQNKVED
jgi:hypothetical protein